MRNRVAMAAAAVAVSFTVGALALGATTQSAPALYRPDFLSSSFTPSDTAVGTIPSVMLSSGTQASQAGRIMTGNFVFVAPIESAVNVSAGSNVNLVGRFSSAVLPSSTPNDDLFLISGASPYSGATSGARFVSATVALAGDFHVTAAHSMLSSVKSGLDLPIFAGLLAKPDALGQSLYASSGQSTVAGLGWDFASWGGLGVLASTTSERAGVLGRATAPVVALGMAKTNAIGASAHASFGDGWVTTVSVTQEVTQLDLKTTNFLETADTRSYGVSVAKRGLFGDNDALGVAVSRPIQMFAGHLGVASNGAIESAADLGNDNVSLLGKAPETDLELGYVTSFFNGALNLQANAAYQMNLEGKSGTNSLAVLSRAKINF